MIYQAKSKAKIKLLKLLTEETENILQGVYALTYAENMAEEDAKELLNKVKRNLKSIIVLIEKS